MRKLRFFKRVVAAVAAVAISVTAIGSYNDSFADKESLMTEMSSIQSEQASVNSKISSADSELSKEKDNLASINKDYAQICEKVEKVQGEASELEKKIADLDEKMRDNERSIESKTQQIKIETDEFMKRIRAMYVAGGSDTYMSVLAGSDDFYDILMRLELMKRVAAHDNDQLDKLIEQKKELETLKKQYSDQRKELDTTMVSYGDKLKELSEQEKKLADLQAASGNTINKLESEKQNLVSKANDLEQKYSQVSSQLLTTTTTTTTSATTKQTTTAKPQATTTKKSTVKTQAAPATQRTQAVTQKTQATQKTTQKTQATQPSTPASSNEKINKVISYAKSNVGGAYVWGGARYRATDCSGLTMLSYAQVGISLPHYAQSQAACGRAVSYNQMQPGDLITFGSAYNVYHVAMYIGNGLMVHAENSNTGIVISNVSSFSRYNPIYNIRRIIG